MGAASQCLAVKHGRWKLGEANNSTVLTRDQVQAIRRLLKESTMSMLAISRQFGVSDTVIRAIRHKKTWKWLPEE